VQTGDVVTAAYLGKLAVFRVLGASERRGPPALAATLYEDLTPKPADLTAAEPPRAASHGPRPTKRDRRRLDAFKA
jgi:ribosome-associated heat shock protein Hsp15